MEGNGGKWRKWRGKWREIEDIEGNGGQKKIPNTSE
jgi:hypothetical protein